MHCFKVLIILLHVYQSSTNDISDWLIRLSSAFDNPVTPRIYDRYYTGPDTRQKKNWFQTQTKRQFFFPNYIVKDPIPSRRRTDDFRVDNFIQPFSVPEYSDSYQSYEGKQKIRNKSNNKVNNYFNQSPISWGLFYKTNDLRTPVLQTNMHGGENLKINDWIPKTSQPHGDGAANVNAGRRDHGKIIVYSRPVLSQTSYILPARRYNTNRDEYKPSKAFTRKSYDNDKTSHFPKKMENNFQTFNDVYKFGNFLKYEEPKEKRKLNTFSEKHILSPHGKISLTHSSTKLSESQNVGKMFLKMFISNPFDHPRFKRSALNLEKTFSSHSNLPKLRKSGDIESNLKYPYYNFFKTGDLLKDSPLKYAENVKNIPLKSEGGTEFYDSKRPRYCSEVESDVDAVPDRIKNKMPEDENDDQDDDEYDAEGDHRSKRQSPRAKRKFEENRGKPRLTGLGDKIDCFKDKYFGTNPLDNPLFYEDTIETPEPIQPPFLMSNSLKKMSQKNYGDAHLLIPLKTITKTPKQLTPAKAQSRLWVNPNKAQNKKDNPLKKTNTNNDYHLNKPTFYANIAKKYPTSNGDNKVSKNKVITNRNVISLPAVIFDKYTQSTDPQTRVYGDIIGNIQSNLKVNTNDEQIRAASVSRPIVRDLYKYKKPNLNNGNYQTYTRKENKHNLSQRVRTKRESELILDLPHTTSEANEDSSDITDVVVSEPVTEVLQPSVAVEKNLDLNDQSGNRKSSIGKPYSDVNRKSRQNYPNGRVEEILEAATFEREKTTQLRNHRRGHSPTTTTKSTSPEELVVEGKGQSPNSKDTEIGQSVSDNDSTQTVTDPNDSDSINDFLNVSNFTGLLNTEYNSSSFHSPGLQNVNSRRSESIFDVSAYLPQPLYFEPQTQNPPPDLPPTLPSILPPTLPPVLQPSRHNISSKYNLHSLPIPTDTQMDDKLHTSQLGENERQRASSEQSTVNPTVAIPRVLVESVNPRNNFKNKVDGKEDIQPIRLPERVTKLYEKQFVTSTARSTTTLRYIPPIENTTKYTEPLRRIKTNSRSRNSQRVRIRKPKVTTTSITTVSTPSYRVPLYNDQDGEAFETSKNIYSNTETIPTTVIIPTTTSTERLTTTHSRRGRRPQRPYQRQYNRENIDSTYEHTPRKPKIVEKTSTKRKTTVITNSKRYENNGNAEPNYDAPIEKQSTIIYNQENSENLPEEPRESESVNHNRDTPSGPAEEAVFTQRDTTVKKPHRGRNRGETRRRPVKEESRYQEDVEEEEIIQERSTPYHGPALAKKINDLSEIEEEQSYRNDGEAGGFSSETVNRQEPEQDNNNQDSEQLNDSYDNDDASASLPVDESYNAENTNNRRTRAGGDVLNDGGMSARILDSFASLIKMDSMTDKPNFEKNPSERLYFYVDES